MNNSTIIKNSFFLLSRTVIVLLVSLFTVRELLSVLGTEYYGLFNLIFGIAVLFTFINGALIVSIQRYLGVKIGRNDNNGIVGVFLTSCIINIKVGVIVFLIMLLLKDIVLYKLLKISGASVVSEKLYLLAMFNTFLIFLQSPFIALINIYEKMKVLAYVSVIEVFLKLFSVYCASLISGLVVINYAIFFTLITFFSFLFYFLYCLVKFKEILNFKGFSLINFKENLYLIGSFMGWTLIGNFAWMSKIQGVNVLLNMFFGLIANAAYAIYNNVFNAINNLLNSITNAIKPQIFISYSKGDISRFNTLIMYGTKFFTIGMVVFIVPIIVFTTEILLFWLKNIPQYSVEFIKLGMVVLLIESISIFLTIGVQAVGKIKIYQIVLGLLLLLNIPIIFLLFKLGFSINSYMYVLMVNSFVCFFARLYFLNKYVKFDSINFIKMCILRIFILFLVNFIIDKSIYEFLLNLKVEDFWYILSIPFVILINLIVAYFLGLDKQDRLNINAILNKVIVRN